MTEYVKATSFSSKDSLPLGNPLKIVKGTEIDTEFNNIATAVATKADLLSPVFTGTPTAPTAATGTSNTQLATTAFATASITPFTGSMLMWPTATAPSGFLLCNGATASRSTYAALFAIVGTIFGAGDGSTTFTLPDYRDRMPIGAGTTYTANSIGGSKDAVVVSHTHATTVSSIGDHVHGMQSSGESGGIGNFIAGAGFTNRTIDTTGAGAHTHTVTNDSTGISGTNANLSPYLGVYFIIKT